MYISLPAIRASETLKDMLQAEPGNCRSASRVDKTSERP